MRTSTLKPQREKKLPKAQENATPVEKPACSAKRDNKIGSKGKGPAHLIKSSAQVDAKEKDQLKMVPTKMQTSPMLVPVKEVKEAQTPKRCLRRELTMQTPSDNEDVEKNKLLILQAEVNWLMMASYNSFRPKIVHCYHTTGQLAKVGLKVELMVVVYVAVDDMEV